MAINSLDGRIIVSATVRFNQVWLSPARSVINDRQPISTIVSSQSPNQQENRLFTRRLYDIVRKADVISCSGVRLIGPH